MRSRMLAVLCALISTTVGAQARRKALPSFEEPVAVGAWIDSLGANAALQSLLDSKRRSQLSNVLSGIRTGDERWLAVLSKLRPPLMATVPAMQFDISASAALDKNPEGVLRVAESIDREWDVLAKIPQGQHPFIGHVCGGYPDEWNENISDKLRAARAVSTLTKRSDAISQLRAPAVSDSIRKGCLDAIANALSNFVHQPTQY